MSPSIRHRGTKVRRILSSAIRQHAGHVGPFDRVRVWWDGMFMHVSVNSTRREPVETTWCGVPVFIGSTGIHAMWMPLSAQESA